MHIKWRSGSESVITHLGGWAQRHGGKICAEIPKNKYIRGALRKLVNEFVKKAAAKSIPLVVIGVTIYDTVTKGFGDALGEQLGESQGTFSERGGQLE